MSYKMDASAYKAAIENAKRQTAKKDPVVEVYSNGWQGRSGDTLLDVVEKQRIWGRDPWFLSKHMQSAISRIVLDEIVLPTMRKGPVRMRAALDKIGTAMLKAVTANYRNARNARGRFRPVSPKRKAIKAAVGLDKRPMFADGELYRSLRYRIT